jgi:hypothetical protein
LYRLVRLHPLRGRPAEPPGFNPRNLFVQRQSTYLGLERAMALRLELLDFILDV